VPTDREKELRREVRDIMSAPAREAEARMLREAAESYEPHVTHVNLRQAMRDRRVTVTILVKVKRRWLVALGVLIMRLGAWIVGARLKRRNEEETDHV
jgi:hypothetical protein